MIKIKTGNKRPSSAPFNPKNLYPPRFPKLVISYMTAVDFSAAPPPSLLMPSVYELLLFGWGPNVFMSLWLSWPS
jgi:hypothetical protein